MASPKTPPPPSPEPALPEPALPEPLAHRVAQCPNCQKRERRNPARLMVCLYHMGWWAGWLAHERFAAGGTP